MIIHGNYPHTLNGAGGKLPKRRPFQQESCLSSNSYLSRANRRNLLLVFYKAFCHSKWPQVSTDHLTLFGWSIEDEIQLGNMDPQLYGSFYSATRSPWNEPTENAYVKARSSGVKLQKRPQRDKNIQKCLLSPIVMEESAIFHLNHQSWEFL